MIPTRVFHSVLGGAPVKVNNGESVWVYGVYVTNTSAGVLTATFETAEAVPVTLMTFVQGAGAFHSFEAPFIADNGVQFAAGAASQKVTVLWRPTG